jgi:hypothetical protein
MSCSSSARTIALFLSVQQQRLRMQLRKQGRGRLRPLSSSVSQAEHHSTPSSGQPVELPDQVLPASFVEAIVAYCMRVIDQSKLKPVGSPQQIADTIPIQQLALSEAVRVLDLICRVSVAGESFLGLQTGTLLIRFLSLSLSLSILSLYLSL